MAGLRRTFGIAEPVRRGMENKIVRCGEWRAQVLGESAGVHGDVLEGRDNHLEWEDVFTGELSLSIIIVVFGVRVKLVSVTLAHKLTLVYGKGNGSCDPVDFHTQLEARLKIKW